MLLEPVSQSDWLPSTAILILKIFNVMTLLRGFGALK